MSDDLEILVLDACESTQDEVRWRLDSREAGAVVAIRTRHQRSGRGREGRTWHDAPDTALLLSVGLQGPAPVAILEELPARIGSALLEVLVDIGAAGLVQWKSPNDLVAAADGAKLAGILIDTRTTGSSVDQVIVGVGCNVRGEAFTTPDGRSATSIDALLRSATDIDELARGFAAAIVRELS